MSRWSPVYVLEIETGRHVKNNACTVEIKIKWMIRKHMTYENTYRDDTIENLCFLGWNLTNSIMNGVEVLVFVKVRLLHGYVLFYPCA
jgi:hypothetical protein